MPPGTLKMSIGIVILARNASTRLPKKHLEPALQDSTTFATILCQRLLTTKIPFILATGENSFDDSLADHCNNFCNVYRGFDFNIPRRILNAAIEQDWEAVIPVDGDDILISLNAIKTIHEFLKLKYSHIMTKNLPFGMNSWGFSIDFLKKSLDPIKSEKIIETGWGRIFTSPALEIPMPIFLNIENLRFSLDYPEDKLFFQEIFKFLIDPIKASEKEIIEIVLSHNLQKINEKTIKPYWENYNREVYLETNNKKAIKLS